MTKAELILLLQKYGIPFQNWGTGNAKTLDHLLKEINYGESSLHETENGLLRKANVIVMDVYYQTSENKLKLFEEKQIYKNGRTTKREPGNSLMEKLKPNEEPFEAAKRTLAEELGITSALELINLGTYTETVVGKSFPGLMHEGTIYKYEVYLTKVEYNPDGYQEIQEDKTNYFIWRPQLS